MDSLVLSNMFHRPARTAISIVGIAVGVLLIVFTVGLANGSIREQAAREANVGAELFFRASGAIGLSGADSFRMDHTIVDEIKTVEGVADAVGIGQNSVDATDNNSGKRTIDGIRFEEYAAISGLKVVEGRQFTPGRDEVIIDTAFQRQKELKIGDTWPIYDRPFTVVGAYEPAGGARLKIALEDMQRQLSSDGKITSVLVAVAPGHTVDDVGLRLQERFPDNQIIRTADIEELYMAGFPAMNVFLNVFIGIAAVISALVILLTMYTTVTERTRQIGIMKSLGMSNVKIGWTITQEALLISFVGVIVGIILTLAARWALNQVTTLEVEISPVVLSIVLVVGLLGGALGALYPAMRAARLDAVEALSYE
ncbi:MAG TPA: ABC transporter permease [Pyrinomonadaceae bacterium]|nr:ABC transporter permease [Pyrinomonadaceae bacterium]